MLVEESWLQFSPSTFYLYMNKMTGWLQTERPSDYRPFLKNDPFEDVISGLFLTADVNRDGYIDDTDFHTVRKCLHYHFHYILIVSAVSLYE